MRATSCTLAIRLQARSSSSRPPRRSRPTVVRTMLLCAPAGQHCSVNDCLGWDLLEDSRQQAWQVTHRTNVIQVSGVATPPCSTGAAINEKE